MKNFSSYENLKSHFINRNYWWKSQRTKSRHKKPVSNKMQLTSQKHTINSKFCHSWTTPVNIGSQDLASCMSGIMIEHTAKSTYKALKEKTISGFLRSDVLENNYLWGKIWTYSSTDEQRSLKVCLVHRWPLKTSLKTGMSVDNDDFSVVRNEFLIPF